MSTTTTSDTRQRITKGSSPFAPGATIAGKQVERWFPLPSAAPVAQHLDRPLRWGKPRHGILTNDLFDGSMPKEEIAAVFGVMAACPQHTFQVLTKRPERMRRWFEAMASPSPTPAGATLPQERMSDWTHLVMGGRAPGMRRMLDASWPLPNVWLGVSVEDQDTADERIALLLQTPAAVRFVSYEPALAGVDFEPWLTVWGVSDPKTGKTECSQLDWLIVGGESGPGARPFDIAWARSAVEQCKEAGVPVFVKQLGARPFYLHRHGDSRSLNETTCRGAGGDMGGFCHHSIDLRERKGGDSSEWPEDLRVREFPEASCPA